MNRLRINRTLLAKVFIVLGTVTNGLLFANIAHATLLDSGADVGKHCLDKYPGSVAYQEVCVQSLCNTRPTVEMAQSCHDKADKAIAKKLAEAQASTSFD